MWSRPWRYGGYSAQQISGRHCEPTGRANARPMTGSAKQSKASTRESTGLLRRFAPRNDEKYTSHREMPRGGQPGERVSEFFPIERLDQKAVHSSFKTGIAILRQGVRCQREDRRLAVRLAGLKATDPPGGFDAVELRHLDVHQNEIVGSTGGFGCQPRFQRRFAIGGDDGMMP